MSDWSMLKEKDSKVIDMAIGEPVFLQECLTRKLLPSIFASTWDVRYPYLGGNPELVDILKSYSGSKYVVVTNGAKHALQSLFAVMAGAGGHRTAALRTPYWPSYKTIAQQHGVTLIDIDKAKDKGVIRICTSPNNPDGHIQREVKCGGFDIWDAAYAHPVYGFDPLMDHIEAVATVHSPAKIFGLSGLRIGWVSTDDEEIARKVAMQVETTTSGVSNVAQQVLARFAKDAQMRNNQALYDEAHHQLAANFTFFNRILAPFCEDVLSDGHGMFAYFSIHPEEFNFEAALKRAGVRAVNGSACGGTENHWRLSMGLPSTQTRMALELLADALCEMSNE